MHLPTGEVTTVWPEGRGHSHGAAGGRRVVGDIPIRHPDRETSFRVAFFNADSGRQVDVVTHMPPPEARDRSYHVHPHPQFCLHDTCIVYTTTVRGVVDVAFVMVEELVAATR